MTPITLLARALGSMNDSMVTVWPAVAEAMHILSPFVQAQQALWEMIEAGAVEILPLASMTFRA